MWLGTRLPFLQIPEEGGREEATAAREIAKDTKTTGQKTQYFKLKHDKAKQQWEAEMERLNPKYNLDCFSDSELDSDWMRGNSITMSMVMRHSYNNEKK